LNKPGILIGLVLIVSLFLCARDASAQTSRGSTGAVSLLNKVQTNIASATTLEYASTIQTFDPTGQRVTLYVHAKLKKPTSVHVTVSYTKLDGQDALLIVGDSNTITAYDPSTNFVASHAVDMSGPNLVLPLGFVRAEPAFPTVRQLFSAAPFDQLFYGDVQSPLTLMSHGVDIPGAQIINAQWPSVLIGQDHIAQMYVIFADMTPRRLLLGTTVDGASHFSYIEDFSTFTLNPKLPDSTFRWTPPPALQPPAASHPAKPSAASKPAPKKAKKARPAQSASRTRLGALV
jgi:outer membrane lipoprotein-sorting protein